MHRRIIVGLVLVLAAGCTTSVAPTSTSGPASPTPPPATATPWPSSPATPAPSAEPFVDLTELVLTEWSDLPATWGELLALPYGDAPEQLGTSPGGEGMDWGPSYGTQLPDGTWWILDAAHLRLAHYSEVGSYLGEARIPQRFLANGEYVQWSTPLALGDGTVVLQSTTIDSPALLLLAPGGGFSRVALPGLLGVKGTDGTHLFGFDEDGTQVRVDPRDGTVTPIDGFAGQSIPGYRLAVGPGRLEITRPGVELALPVSAQGRESASVYLSLEATDGSDGVLNLLVSGIVEDSDGDVRDVAGFVRLNAEGRGVVEPVRPLTSAADPADGLHLGVRLGDHRPWLMVIDPDALRVYRRTT